MKQVISLFCLLLAGCSPRPVSDPGTGTPRVVSLAPSLTEIVCAVGGPEMLVGRTSACDYPIEILDRTPVVANFGTPSMEMILSVKPTLLLQASLADKSMGTQMESMGLKPHTILCKTLDDIPHAIREVGDCLGRSQKAAAIAEQLARQINEYRESAPPLSKQPTVFIELSDDPLITAGGGSFMSELVSVAGGRNLFDDADQDYFQVDAELVVARDPDVILYCQMKDSGKALERIKARAGWKDVKAVRSGRVYDHISDNLLTRPGPRIIEGIKQLRSCLQDTARE